MFSPLYFFSGYSVLFDIHSRLSINDAPLGTYYFWWTNMTYLPSFFFALCVLAIHIQPHSLLFFSPPLIYCTLTCLYSVELLDYVLLNHSLSTSVYSSSGLNTLLTNVLNRYHPFVFYLSTFFLLIWFFYHYSTQLIRTVSILIP